MNYIQNVPQKFMVKNLDDCYLRENKYGAEFFFMLEDDNQIRPRFISTGIDIIEQMAVAVCQMNQVIEHNSGQPDAYISDLGIFDGTFDERTHTPDEIRLAMFGAIGISNGAVFWSKNITRELAIRGSTMPTLEEYLRSSLLENSVYICREKLAVWAKNEQFTNRNLGVSHKHRRRELDLKASLISLRRRTWEKTPRQLREQFLNGGVLRIPMESRRAALDKSGIPYGGAFNFDRGHATAKRLAIQALGKVHPSVATCLSQRSDS